MPNLDDQGEDQFTVFGNELQKLINSCSIDSACNTPDFILASYMMDSLSKFIKATSEREKWYGVHLEPGRPMRNVVGSPNLRGIHDNVRT